MNISESNIKEELFMKGLKAFNEKEFYDAHEFWEELWSDFYLKDAKFIQALIQLSVGYFHITNNNKNGANGLFKKSIPKFELYLPYKRGIDVKTILNSIYKSIECINQIKRLEDFNWELAPKIIIKKNG